MAKYYFTWLLGLACRSASLGQHVLCHNILIAAYVKKAVSVLLANTSESFPYATAESVTDTAGNALKLAVWFEV